MKFAIAELSYFDSLGYDTSNWRKSLDGSKAVVHYEFAMILCDESALDVYNHDDEEFKTILDGPGWMSEEEE